MLALAAGLATIAVVPASALPILVPVAPAVRSDVVAVASSKVVRRHESAHDEGGVWKKRRHLRDAVRPERHHRRVHKGERHGGHGNDWIYRPQATPKRAYDAYGNFRVYDDDGWESHRKWDKWDHGKRKHPRVLRRMSTSTGPSPELKEILTAVPD
jgi:hypothetical protein